MKPTLVPGAVHEFFFVVPPTKTVPHLYPESEDFRSMPEVFATGFMVGLLEWACIDALKPHLEPGEGSLGIGIDVTHVAATPPGMKVTVTATCRSVDGNRIEWHVAARDELDAIGEGLHRRAVVRWEGFNARLDKKLARWRGE